MIPLSILDLAFVAEDSSPAVALHDSLKLAQHAEKWGYRRFWLAEHHNMAGIASSATSVAIAYVAGGTSTIRVGAGGIMLPNHSPLVIAEQFGTLGSLFPDRIDLGLGRAPGTDQMTLQALRRSPSASDHFPEDVMELQSYFEPARPGQAIQAVPGAGVSVPLWILGSSLFGAQLAAQLGLPYAFASHFAPAALFQAIKVYRDQFTPSKEWDRSYCAAGINVIIAETDAQAQRDFTSLQQQFLRLIRGSPGRLPLPVDHIHTLWLPHERDYVMDKLSCSFVGTAERVRKALEIFVERTGVDELIVSTPVVDQEARLRSYEALRDLWK